MDGRNNKKDKETQPQDPGFIKLKSLKQDHPSRTRQGCKMLGAANPPPAPGSSQGTFLPASACSTGTP